MHSNASAASVEEMLVNVLTNPESAVDYIAESLHGDDVSAAGGFIERGVMTANRGLVLELGDGSEYQITIVRSK